MSWLVGAVLLVTPMEAFAYDHPLVFATVPLRAGILLLMLWGLRSSRLSPIAAGRLFLSQGLLTMVSWSIFLDSEPTRVAIATLAQGTILPTCTLLIAPKESRRSWAFLVWCVVLCPAVAHLTPDHMGLLAQVVAALLVHGAAVAALDAHANKAELAGEMAGLDPLTGLLNRRSALDHLAVAADSAGCIGATASVILLDLDHFKQVNDVLGHEAGDETLRRVARVLQAFVRPGDSVCRWGGEEFVIVLPDADQTMALKIAELLRLRLMNTVVSASFGVAEIDAGNTVTSWVRRADDAMFVAKREGRNAVCVAASAETLAS